MTTKRSVLGVVAASFLGLLMALSAGCGGGGGSDPTPPANDNVAPAVLSDQVVPAVGATVQKRALSVTLPFSEPIACFTGEQPFSDNGLTGKATCQGNTITMVFDDASLAGKSSVTATLSKLTDLAGNPMVPFSWSYQLQVDPATVALSAAPSEESTTLTWTTTNAASCEGSGGLSGPLNPAGGSLVVTPTTTTTYGVQCRNIVNIATEVASVTVTVTPKPVVTYPAAVVVFGSNWIYRVDPTVPGGVVPIANNSGHDFYAYGFRATVLPNCQIQVSGLDNYNFAPLQFIWDRKKEEINLDTTGTAPPRLVGNYVYAVLPDPAFPDTVINVMVGDERFFVLNFSDYRTLWYQKGTAPAVALGTYPLGIKAVIAYPACTPQ